MAYSIKKLIAASTLAATLTFGAVIPAAAGSFTVMVTPQDAQQEQAMKMGLGFIALANGMSKNGGISQNGMNNMAGVLQNGGDNQAVIIQEGNGHAGTIEQNGNGNACGLFQMGENTQTHIEQNGGATCLAFQFGF